MMNALSFGTSSRLRIQYSKIQYCTVKPIYGFYGVRNARTPGYCPILEKADCVENCGNDPSPSQDPRGRSTSISPLLMSRRESRKQTGVSSSRLHARTHTPFRNKFGRMMKRRESKRKNPATLARFFR